MNRPNPKDILFWSPKCPYSRNLMEKINSTPLINQITPFNVHDKRFKLPPFVTAVPTLYLKAQRTVLVNENLTQWMNQELHKLTNRQISQGNMPGNAQPAPTGHQSNPNTGNYRQQMPQNNKKPLATNTDDLTGEATKQFTGGISEFNPGEMSSGFSDQYSFLENDKAVASHGFTFIGEADDTPPITNIDSNGKDMGDFPANGDNGNNQNNNQNMNQNPNQYGGGSEYNSNNMNYNPNPPPPQPQGGGGNPYGGGNPGGGNPYGGGGGNSYGGNPSGSVYGENPFGENTHNDNQKQQDLDRRYAQLMNDRDISDSLSELGNMNGLSM